ncbi:MAG: beta-ketoacyl-[acyl-carrier-protein] synthase [Nevskia sp.]|nr:beta-ketoacyl-[acyl-carrier-protein] synthase [Nevskia sp.]
MKPLAVSHYTVTTACGRGNAALLDALRSGRTGLHHGQFEAGAMDSWFGAVDQLDEPLPEEHAGWDCRVNRLLAATLQQDGFMQAVASLRERYGAARIGVFVGTSTSGVQQAEFAYRDRDRAGNRLPQWFDYNHTQSIHVPAEFARLLLGLSGCCMTISTACSSSAKVFAAAARAIRAGLCDAAVVGGVDSLCLTTLYGFNSLQLVSPEICRPADARRNGISIGEAGGFAIVDPQWVADAPALLGYGESGDAHHMSTPDPEGRGARAAMQGALDSAGVAPKAVDYINLHGTATQANDLAEDRAVYALFGGVVPCSSTKGWSGHTLGAAGMVEAAVAMLCIEHGLIPQSLNTEELDPLLRGAIVTRTRAAGIERVLSNSFGFGGSNCSLLFGRLT